MPSPSRAGARPELPSPAAAQGRLFHASAAIRPAPLRVGLSPLSPTTPGDSHVRRRRPSHAALQRLLRSPHLCFFLGALLSQSIVFLLPLSFDLSRRGAPLEAVLAGLHRKGFTRGERPYSATMAGFRPKFVLFGDSLTQHSFSAGGWGAALQNQYARKVDVVLRGYSGYNTRWALFLVPKIFPPRGLPTDDAPLTLVTIFFGANDAALPNRNSKKQHVPVDEYRRNLIKIAKAVQACSSTAKIVLIAPPPVDEPARLRFYKEAYKENAITENERLNSVTGQYAEACRQAAAELGVPVVDLWTRLQERPQWQALLSDGLHFTKTGDKVVFEEVYAAISKSFPELQWDKLPWDFPEHTEIDGEKPYLTFQ